MIDSLILPHACVNKRTLYTVNIDPHISNLGANLVNVSLVLTVYSFTVTYILDEGGISVT